MQNSQAPGKAMFGAAVACSRCLLMTMLATILVPSPVHAVALLTFDDDSEIGPGNLFGGVSYAGVHHGFLFTTDSYVLRACDAPADGEYSLPASGYCTGTISPHNVLFGGYANEFGFGRPSQNLFSIFGLHMTPAWAHDLKTVVTGYRNNEPIYRDTPPLPSPKVATYVNLNFIGIDRIAIETEGGATEGGAHIAFDDIEYAIAVCPSALSRYNNTSPAVLGSNIYFTYAELDNCWGRITSTALDPQTGTIAERPDWDGSCNLTGDADAPACTKSGVRPLPLAVQDNRPAARQIAVNDAALGMRPFRANRLGALSATDTQLLRYVRGERGAEVNADVRVRTSVLGDIINSSPLALGPPDGQRENQLVDRLHGTESIAMELRQQAAHYAAFKSAHSQRLPVVYVGANDGMLHGFSAGMRTRKGMPPVPRGATDAARLFNDGAELIAYMPATVWANLKANAHGTYATLNYRDKNYGHHFYVDASPVAGDVFYRGAWHTLLATGLGAGGPGTERSPAHGAWIVSRESETAYGTVAILDVTDPASFSDSKADLLFKEFSILKPTRCLRPAAANTTQRPEPCMPNLGAQYGTPSIQRMHNGDFAIVFGNGLYSQNGNAGVFVVLIDRSDGATRTYYLNAAASSVVGKKNGIVHVTPMDIDTDGMVDYLYAGDVQGNVWRFDVTAADPNAWRGVERVFSTPNKQPITTAVVASVVADEDRNFLMLGFGTGRVWPLESPEAPQYVRGAQSIYGLWDSNFQRWNQKSSFQLATSHPLPANAQLQRQTVDTPVVHDGVHYRTGKSQEPCWLDQPLKSPCTVSNHWGWEYQLPAPALGENEQVVSNPVLFGGNMLVNTITPKKNTGYTMVFNLRTGTPPNRGFFARAGYIEGINGAQFDAAGAPVVVPRSAETGQLYFKNTSQAIGMVDLSLRAPERVVKRVTWRILR